MKNITLSGNKYLLKQVFFILLLFQHTIYGQENRIQSMKVAYITQMVNLTPEEAQVFWPVYNQYQGKLNELRNNHRKEIVKYKQNADALSNKELEDAVDSEITFKQQELNIQKEFHTKVKTILPIKKVGKLYIAEEQFKLKLIEELKERKTRQAR